MKKTPFIFIDNNTIYSSYGKFLTLSKEDIDNYIENDFSDEEIKSMLYYYLTDVSLNHFIHETDEQNEF